MLQKILCFALLIIVTLALLFYSFYFKVNNRCELSQISQIKSIILYDTQGNGSSLDFGFENITSFAISESQTKTIMTNVSYNSGNMLWKGWYLGRAALTSDEYVTIMFSYYGAFFKIVSQDGYYQTHGDSRIELERVLQKATNEVFIPQR